jgi:hypothetical protein
MLNRLMPLALALTAAACTSNTPAASDVASVSSGVTNFTVYVQAIDLAQTQGPAPAYLPEAQVNLLTGHSYQLQAALYTKGVPGYTDGDLLWGSSSSAAACLPVRTSVLKATDVAITMPLCHYLPDQGFTVDTATTATITISRDSKSLHQGTSTDASTDAKARADLVTACQPVAVISRLPANQAALAYEVQAATDASSCTCGSWTIPLSAFESQFQAKGIDYSAACAAELVQENPEPKQTDPATLFQAQCSPAVVAGYLPAGRATLADVVQMDGNLCSCGGWEISLSVFQSEYVAQNESYAKDCAAVLVSSQPVADPVHDAFVASCKTETIAGLLPASSANLAASVVLSADGQSCACGGWTITFNVYRDAFYGKTPSYAQTCANQLVR